METTNYSPAGIDFITEYAGQPIEFPLQLNRCAGIENSNEWERFQLLDSLWDEGFLSPTEHGYRMNAHDIYKLTDEEMQVLKLPTKHVSISVKEHGNVAMPSHSFNCKYLYRGNSLNGATRIGNVLNKGNDFYLLDEEQWKLVETIEKKPEKDDIQLRSKHFAHVKKLAQIAGAKIDNGIEKREFRFLENPELGIEEISDHELHAVPAYEGVKENHSKEVIDHLDGTVVLNDNGKSYRYFFDDTALRKGKAIKGMEPITGAKVPEFLENPYPFIPEEIEFDEKLFADRVKGLKVRRASAAPYVNIESTGDSGGWFTCSTGIQVTPDDDSEEWQIDNYDEFKEKVDAAVKNGESYVYIDNQWVKVSPGISDFIEATKEAGKFQQGGKISRDDTKKILDIYDNLDLIEYNETINEIREELQNPLHRYSVPKSFNGILDDYQIEGYNFLRLQKELHMGSLIADDMGLGKTVQVIALLSYLAETRELEPLLIVLPTGIIQNWINELNKFLPSLNGIYIHSGADRVKNADFISSTNITLVSYETLARDQVLLGTVKWSYIICDETQKIKNSNTLAASAVKGMNAKSRIAMTGTPIENNLSELWSIIDFIQPGLLKSHREFVKYYEKPLKTDPDNTELKNLLIEKIKPVFIRRTKKDLLSNVLPRKTEYTLPVKMSSIQKEAYYKIIDDVKNNKEGKGKHLGAIQKLIEVCSHPALVETHCTLTVKQMMDQSPKLQKTLEILEDIRKRDEKVIIFTRYKKMQAMLRRVIFDIFQVDANIINGENSSARTFKLNTFQNAPGFNVLILSPKAAGVGLNITAANHVIHYTREWNPAVENQCTDRAYRRGQEKDVSVYYPIVTDDEFTTVEAKLDKLLKQKSALLEDIIIVNSLDVGKELEEIFE